MTIEEIYAGLTEIFQDVFGDDRIVLTPDMTAADVRGWDSMRMVTIIVAAEARFGMRIQNQEIEQLRSVGDFVGLIGTKLRR